MKQVKQGVIVNTGVIKSRAVVIKSDEDVLKEVNGGIVILKNSDPVYAICVMNASGVICENGGKLSHICIVALEMGLPCITQVANATEDISDGQIIYMDAFQNIIEIE